MGEGGGQGTALMNDKRLILRPKLRVPMTLHPYHK
jgi:hypothetical protein